MSKLLLVTVGFLLLSIPLHSQSLLSTSGNEYRNDSILLSWSIGEPVIHTLQASGLIVTQGLHQTKILLSAVFFKDEELSIKVFPNPVKEILFLETASPEGMMFKLYNSMGVLLKHSKLCFSHNELPVSDLPSGIYYLAIFKGNIQYRTYKITIIK